MLSLFCSVYHKVYIFVIGITNLPLPLGEPRMLYKNLYFPQKEHRRYFVSAVLFFASCVCIPENGLTPLPECCVRIPDRYPRRSSGFLWLPAEWDSAGSGAG